MDYTWTSQTSKRTIVFCVILLSCVAAAVNGMSLHRSDNKTSFQWCVGLDQELRFSLQNVNNAEEEFDVYVKHKKRSGDVYSTICLLKLTRGTCSTKQKSCNCTSEEDFQYTWFRQVKGEDGGEWLFDLLQSSGDPNKFTVDVIYCPVTDLPQISLPPSDAATPDGGPNVFVVILVVVSCCCAAVIGTLSFLLYRQIRQRRRKQITLAAVNKKECSNSYAEIFDIFNPADLVSSDANDRGYESLVRTQDNAYSEILELRKLLRYMPVPAPCSKRLTTAHPGGLTSGQSLHQRSEKRELQGNLAPNKLRVDIWPVNSLSAAPVRPDSNLTSQRWSIPAYLFSEEEENLYFTPVFEPELNCNTSEASPKENVAILSSTPGQDENENPYLLPVTDAHEIPHPMQDLESRHNMTPEL